MCNLYWLTDDQMARLGPYFPNSHGKPRVDARRALSGIGFVNRNGLRRCGAPKGHALHKTLYNRWKRRGEKGIQPCIPGRKSRLEPVRYDTRRYRRRSASRSCSAA
jgi:hypothetical protein